jgi:hypothetical protein
VTPPVGLSLSLSGPCVSSLFSLSFTHHVVPGHQHLTAFPQSLPVHLLCSGSAAHRRNSRVAPRHPLLDNCYHWPHTCARPTTPFCRRFRPLPRWCHQTRLLPPLRHCCHHRFPRQEPSRQGTQHVTACHLPHVRLCGTELLHACTVSLGHTERCQALSITLTHPIHSKLATTTKRSPFVTICQSPHRPLVRSIIVACLLSALVSRAAHTPIFPLLITAGDSPLCGSPFSSSRCQNTLGARRSL